MIKISEKFASKWTFNCGPGTNTRAKLLGVWETLILASRLHIFDIQVFGDSKIIIDWCNCKGKLQVISSDSWKVKIRFLSKTFSSLSFSHIHREYNKEVDILSKKAHKMQEGKISYNQWEEGNEGPTLFLNL